MAAEAEANGAPAPVPGPPEPPEPSVAERLASVGWSVARNWQVFFAALVAWAAIWLWVSNAEPEVSAGTFSVDEYLTYATERIGWAGKAKLPRGARRRSAWLANALAALENMEANYGVIDDHEHWRAVEYLGDVQRELAMLRREYPRDVAEIVKSKPADLLVAAAADYRRALAMRSPRPGDVRRVTIGLAGALSDLGQHREVVDVLLPMVRELRRDDVDRLRREKDENEVSIADGGGEALSPFETRVHMAMAGSLRELGRPDEAERHFGFVAAGGSGAHRWLARLRLGDIAVTKALSPDRRDAAELARAIAFYRDVYSAVPPEDPKRLKAGMRLGGALLAAGDAKSAAEVFAEAAGDAAAAEVRGWRLAELMRGVSLVARAE